MTPELQKLSYQAGVVFTPGAPINEKDLFAGRQGQVEKIVDAVWQRGCHVILYGERGVGKTSLSNMISTFLTNQMSYVVSRTNCDVSDDFSSLWGKALADIDASLQHPQFGLSARQPVSLAPLRDKSMTPDSVRRTLQERTSSASLIVVFDEFDRIKNNDVITAMSDTIKALSDNSVNVTILIIGVADSVNELIREHQSIERALVQVPMPRMSDDEIRDIVEKGLTRLTMGIDRSALDEIVLFSQGVPYIAHSLCIFTCRAALASGRKTVFSAHVAQGMTRALDQWQQSIKALYAQATQSAAPGNLYREVLLACALAEVDDFRYFRAGAIQKPLSQITNHDHAILNYTRHLRELCEPNRGKVLQRTEGSGKPLYRITNPNFRSYIVMRGISDELINRANLSRWKSEGLAAAAE